MRVILLLLILVLSSCSLAYEDLSEVKALAAQKQYQEAITAMSKFSSNESKKYNSELHTLLAVQKLKDLERSQEDRYQEAITLLAEAIKLDPKNNKARTVYMLLMNLRSR